APACSEAGAMRRLSPTSRPMAPWLWCFACFSSQVVAMARPAPRGCADGGDPSLAADGVLEVRPRHRIEIPDQRPRGRLRGARLRCPGDPSALGAGWAG